MNVKMRYALTDPIVDRDKGTFGCQALLNSACEQLGIAEKGPDQGSR